MKSAEALSDLIAQGLLVINDGYRTKTAELGKPGYPILRVAEVGDGFIGPSYGDHVRSGYRDKISVKLSQPGDVLLTTKGTVGRRAIMPHGLPEFAYSPQLCFFRVLDESTIDHRWLYYWLGGSEFWSQAVGVSTQTDMAPYISLSDLRAIQVNLPPVDEQRGIAATLGALDDKIESNRRLIELSLRLLDALAADATLSLPSARLADLVLVAKDTVNPATLGTEVVDHFSLPAFDNGGLPERMAAEAIMSNKLALPGRSILLSRLNPRINRTWWATPTDGIPALSSTEFLCIRASSDSELAAVWLALRSEDFLDELPARVTGTSGSHQRVRPDDVLAIEVPDVSRLPQLVKLTALGLLESAEQRTEEIAHLAALRDALLPEMLSGRIRVPEAACAMAEGGE